MTDYFAATPKNLEQLLARELETFGAENIKETVAGVSFTGSSETVYRALLWSRLASRIILPLSSFPVASPEDLYAGAHALDWSAQFGVDQTFLVDSVVRGPVMTHGQYAAQKLKDAVVDQFRSRFGRRPSVDRVNPDIRIDLVIKNGIARIGLDLSGPSLHQRGYRQRAGSAPLKENLAAAILIRSGWPTIAESNGSLIDILCGSGVLLIEAGLIAADIAPGLTRKKYSLTSWRSFDAELWRRLLSEAETRKKEGLARVLAGGAAFLGADHDGSVLSAARANIEHAGLARLIQLEQRSVADWRPQDLSGKPPGLVIGNPPYGERLGDLPELAVLYPRLGETLIESFEGWRGSILTGNPELGKTMGLRAAKKYNFLNGTIPCSLLLFDLDKTALFRRQDTNNEAVQADSTRSTSLSPGAVMFRNRLKKNLKQRRKWAKREALTCFRVYDADLPEYNVAIDIYGGHAVVQEYRAPAEIPIEKTRRRLHEILRVAPEVLEIGAENITLKQRARQRGENQYGPLHRGGEFIEVSERDLKFWVNLRDYLDTGLFCDHRPVRGLIREMAAGGRFLNLFAYTGAATVYAAAGGARTTTTVDLSKTYLDWAQRNMALNAFHGKSHHYIEADCLSWLDQATGRFDLILLDPPHLFQFEEDRTHLRYTTRPSTADPKNRLAITSSGRPHFFV